MAYALALDDVRFEYAVIKPYPIFTADNLRTHSYKNIEFKNNTDAPEEYPVTKWEWSFIPSTVSYKMELMLTLKIL
ncbi:hypothetical protein [Riemerella columbipharyngis]|uniref:Uncharacterized protein n=1 Tax=Riemerella columbipharyngis TaxID=1071918 RepID=A0A1G7AQC7_9FLAO|nr:hypothetical protein [Riemerella columbipharyngis]SDE16993.1 hypothetical protein SAMN05421544_10456 [Riemerella columbipharyngis]